MAMQKIAVRPGVNTQASQTLNQGGWSLSNLIRFKDGLVEKFGGWQHLSPTPCIGTVRGLCAWADLNGISYLAFGSEQRLQIYTGGQTFDITPIRKTTNTANIVSTTSTSAEVKITDAAHGASVGDWIYLPIYVAIGGLLLFGFYQVDSVIDANNYTFNAGAPATSTVNLGGATPAFTTTITSATVKVTLANHGFSTNQLFGVPVATVVGGLTISGTYLVASVIDANNFNITAASPAGSSAGPVSENGGNVQILYLIASGNASDTQQRGWGGGLYGMGTWGMGAGGTTQLVPHRDWWLANFGQNLQAVPTNGPLYQWIPPASVGNVATVVSQAPSVNAAMFIGMPQEQVILLGSSVGGVQDPMLIAWCDAGDNTDWTATAANQAGTFRLPRGSRIVGGLQAPLFGLIWTDVGVWGMQYTQPPFVYSFLELGSGCGLISPRAACVVGDDVPWMSTRGFYSITGGQLSALPCTVFDKVFGNIFTAQQSKIFAGANSLFHEATWFYPSAGGSGEIDSYVKLNSLEKTWDYGSLVRTAWVDQNVFGPPIGVDGTPLIQQHEMGTDADGVPMSGVVAETGYVDIANGEQFVFIDQLIPDFVWAGAGPQQLTLTIYGTNEPGVPPTAYGPYTVTPATTYLTIRARHRQIALKIEADGIGVFWRLGAIRYRGAPDGRV